MDTLLLLESAEHGAALTLQAHDADYFIAEVRSNGLDATTKVGTFMSDGLHRFFSEMAEQWRGWSGEKHWSALEGELSLQAHADRLGHVFLTVRMRKGHPPYWEVEANLTLEAGQLDRITAAARAFEASVFRDA